MPSSESSSFPQVWLDLTNERLWCGTQAIALRPKTFHVLRYLIEHPGQLLFKGTLLEAIWPEATVSEVVLAVCIRELRQALGDDPKVPRFIETVHRRGYRFIGTIPAVSGAQATRAADTWLEGTPVQPWHSIRLLVGREAELHHIHRHLAKALTGVRQVLFVTGEAGLGKTALVEAFLAGVDTYGSLWVGRGQCFEHYGTEEAYLPVFDALGRLCQGTGGQDIVALLTQHAPTWLVHMPGLLTPAEHAELQRRVRGATQGRMVREMVEAIDRLTVRQPLVLVLEDLHWSDYSTLDLLTALGRRREPARLLILGTYRPPEVLQRGHPLQTVQHELHLHGQCAELPLTLLTAMAMDDYLSCRFPHRNFPAALVRLLHQRTEGNPLFMVTVVEDWLDRGWLTQVDGLWTVRTDLTTLVEHVPEDLRQVLYHQLDRLGPLEQQVIAVGSIAGSEFAAATVAAGLQQDVVLVEETCASLARRSQLLQAIGERRWPDGTITHNYRFTHALYQEAMYDRITAAQRIVLHQRVGEREELGYGTQTGEHAAALAMHFERGRDYRRAFLYRRQAADHALQKYANTEAITHLLGALTLIATLPDAQERMQQELLLRTTLGAALTATKGYGAPDVAQNYAQALALCQQVGDTAQLFSIRRGLSAFYQQRGDLQTTQSLAVQLLASAQRSGNPALLLRAHQVQGSTLFYRGELLQARASLEQGMTFHNAAAQHSRTFSSGLNTGVVCLGHLAWALWCLGYPEQARCTSHEAVVLAQQSPHPHSLAYALHFSSVIQQFHGQAQDVRVRAEEVLAISAEQELAFWLAYGTIMRGWAVALQGESAAGLALLQQGLAAQRGTGAELGRAYFLALLAEVYGLAGQPVQGIEALSEALTAVKNSGECFYKAELYRLRGECLLRQGGTKPQAVAAEESFARACSIARQQQARSLELRATMSLCRLWQQQGKRTAAYDLLAALYDWFREGFDTADVLEAKTLLKELA